MRLFSMMRVSGLLALLIFGFAGYASALDYPVKPVRLVYPFAPGTPGDVFWRPLSTGLAKAWKQPVIVDNKPGAGGIIAAENVLASPPDGYSLLAAGTTLLSLGLFNKVSFDPAKDFRLVAITYIADAVLVTNSQVPARNLAEFVAFAKTNPGKLNYASLGRNSIMMYLEWFKQATGAPLAEIPYKGTPQQIEAMLRNDVHLMYIPARGVKPLIDGGRLTPLFVVSKERLSDLPNVPTNAEAGLPDYQPPQWTAVLASARVPDDIVQRIRADLAPVLATPELTEVMFRQGNSPYKGTPKEADELLDFSAKVLFDLARKLNIKPE